MRLLSTGVADNLVIESPLRPFDDIYFIGCHFTPKKPSPLCASSLIDSKSAICVLPHGHARSSCCRLKGRQILNRALKHSMLEKLRAALILVVEDVHEISVGIERLLKTDGYRVTLARDELEAIESAQLMRPDLILMNWTGLSGQVLATVRRIREQSAVEDKIPVIFWVEDINEGEEVALEGNVYLTRPDSFNQLRGLLAYLLDHEIPRVHGGPEFATE